MRERMIKPYLRSESDVPLSHIDGDLNLLGLSRTMTSVMNLLQGDTCNILGIPFKYLDLLTILDGDTMYIELSIKSSGGQVQDSIHKIVYDMNSDDLTISIASGDNTNFVELYIDDNYEFATIAFDAPLENTYYSKAVWYLESEFVPTTTPILLES